MSDAPGRDGSQQPVPELLDVRRADVYEGGALAAHLERRSDGAVAFAYTSSWVRNFGPPVATTLPALSVDGRRDGVTGARFLALAERVGVRERAARVIVLEVADSADAWLGRLDEIPLGQGRVSKLRRFVLNRQKLLRTGV